VGAKVAQDPMQHLTQTTLKHFHFAGEKTTIVDSMTRVKEILNMRPNIQQPRMYISILPEFEETFEPMSIVELRLDDLTLQCDDRPYRQQSQEVFLAHMRSQLPAESIQHFDNAVTDADKNPDLQPVFVTCYLNKRVMCQRELSPRILAHYVKLVALQDVDADMSVVTYAELTDEEWWLTIAIIRKHAAPLLKAVSKEWKHLALSLAMPMLSLYLRHTLIHARTLLAGVDGIRGFRLTERMLVDKDETQDDKLVERKVSCYELMGSNVQGVCSLPQVDVRLVTSNNIHQIYAEFGIAAAQKCIEDSLSEAIESSDKRVALQHIRLIAAAMCFGGYPAPLTFSGMTSHETATWFKRATFERSLDSFLGAGVRARPDNLEGISEAIVVGAQIRVGTGGNFELITDQEKIENEGLVQEARTSMQWCVPNIQDFLTKGPTNGLTDESVQLRFDMPKKVAPGAANNAAQQQAARSKTGTGGGGQPGTKRLRTHAYTEALNKLVLHYADGPIVPQSPVPEPQFAKLHYGASDLLIPPSPKMRKKNESRKNHKRRFGDKDMTEEDLLNCAHLIDAAEPAPLRRRKRPEKSPPALPKKRQLELRTKPAG